MTMYGNEEESVVFTKCAEVYTLLTEATTPYDKEEVIIYTVGVLAAMLSDYINEYPEEEHLGKKKLYDHLEEILWEEPLTEEECI